MVFLLGGISMPTSGANSANKGQISNADLSSSNIVKNLTDDNQGPQLELAVRPAKGVGLVAVGVAEDAGEFYRAFGRKIRLFRSLDKVVVQEPTIEEARTQLNAAGQTQFELESVVPAQNRNIFRALTRLQKDSLQAVLDVVDADPVYINEETGSEVIVTDRFVVRLADGADLEALEAVNRAEGVVILAPIHASQREYVCQKAGLSAPEMLVLCETYHQDRAIEWVSPDFVFKLKLRYSPTDPLYADQWHLHNYGQTGGVSDADIDAPEAWDRTDTPKGGSSDIVISIIDTGVDLDHEDLDDNIYVNQAEAGGIPGIDDDGNGYIDDLNGWDFYDDDNTPDPTAAGSLSPHPHGTSCAGVAAAEEGNSLGGVGAAFNCKILPVKISSDDGIFATSTDIGNAIRYAADMAHVLSNSWGGGGDDSVIHSAIQYAVNTKGKVVLFASGNDADGTNTSPAWIHYTLSGFSAGSYTFKWEYSKDSSVSSGDDTVWVDDITFPGGAFEGFEGGTFPPPGWVTDSWTQYTESKHVTGIGCKSAQAGPITHSQTTYLQTTKSVSSGDLQYMAWVSSEAGCDIFQIYVNGSPYLPNSGVPTVDYDVGYPALYAECIAVGASTDFDRRSAYSQYDETLSNVLDVVAPSNGTSYLTSGITTTDIAGTYGYSSGDYTSDFGGTSSATPLAAGVAALVLSKNPNLTPSEVQNILEGSAEEIGCQSYSSHYNKYYGHGRINADAALAATPTSGLLGEIHGFKWDDINSDEVWDRNVEPPLGGWKIYLDPNDNGKWDSEEPFYITEPNGVYHFTNLDPGTYIVAEVQQVECPQTYPPTGTHTIILGPGEKRENVNFGNHCPACGDWGYFRGDLNFDCYVDLKDVAILALDWLLCSHPDDPINCQPVSP